MKKSKEEEMVIVSMELRLFVFLNNIQGIVYLGKMGNGVKSIFLNSFRLVIKVSLIFWIVF